MSLKHCRRPSSQISDSNSLQKYEAPGGKLAILSHRRVTHTHTDSLNNNKKVKKTKPVQPLKVNKHLNH